MSVLIVLECLFADLCKVTVGHATEVAGVSKHGLEANVRAHRYNQL